MVLFPLSHTTNFKRSAGQCLSRSLLNSGVLPVQTAASAALTSVPARVLVVSARFQDVQDEMHSFSGKGGLSNISEEYIALNLVAQTFSPLKGGVTQSI